MKKSLLTISVTVLMLGLHITAAAQDVPLRVKIEVYPNAYILATSPYRIIGDTRDYVDGKDGIYARFQVVNWSNDFIMDPTNKPVRSPRALWFDFSNKVAAGTLANPWDGQGLVKIDTYLNFNEVYTVPVDSYNSYTRNGGFGQLYSKNSKIVYRVFFQARADSPNLTVVNTPNPTAFVEVRHPDCNTWIMTPQVVNYFDSGYGSGSGAVSALVDPSNGVSAGQYLMPFKITLTRVTPVATCQ